MKRFLSGAAALLAFAVPALAQSGPDSWSHLPPPRVGGGISTVAVGTGNVYVNSYPAFSRYTISTNSWTSLAPWYAGGQSVYLAGYVYSFGNAYQNWGRFDTAATDPGSW